MKYPIPAANISFNAVAKTITFSTTIPVGIENIMHVANITRGVIYFQPQAGSVYSGSYTSPVLTINADTTGHSNTDKLLVIYDDGSIGLTDTQLRATAVPVSAASLPLPTGGATSALQTTGNTSLSSIDGKLPALQSGALPVGDNGGQLTVDGKAYSVTLNITRPANITAYSAGDVIGTGSGDDAILTLSSVGPSGGFVIIQSIELVIGISTVPSGMTTFRLHFYSTKPQTAAADNSVFDLNSVDRGAYVGYIDLPTPTDLGSTCFSQIDYPGKLFKLASASSSLFCELQTLTAFTPSANSESYSLRIRTLEAGL